MENTAEQTTSSTTRNFTLGFPFFRYSKHSVSKEVVPYPTTVLRLLQRGLLQRALDVSQKMGEEERKIFAREEVMPRIIDSRDTECMAWYLCTEGLGQYAVRYTTTFRRVWPNNYDWWSGLVRIPYRDRMEVVPSEMCQEILRRGSQETVVTFLENVQREYCLPLTLEAHGYAIRESNPERANAVWEKTLQRCPLDNTSATLIYYHHRHHLRPEVAEFMEKRMQSSESQ